MERDPWMVLEHACIKQTVKSTITYNPNGIISNTGDLMQYMADLSNICILT